MANEITIVLRAYDDLDEERWISILNDTFKFFGIDAEVLDVESEAV